MDWSKHASPGKEENEKYVYLGRQSLVVRTRVLGQVSIRPSYSKRVSGWRFCECSSMAYPVAKQNPEGTGVADCCNIRMKGRYKSWDGNDWRTWRSVR